MFESRVSYLMVQSFETRMQPELVPSAEGEGAQRPLGRVCFEVKICVRISQCERNISLGKSQTNKSLNVSVVV
jgi:hypothetical protein